MILLFSLVPITTIWMK